MFKYYFKFIIVLLIYSQLPAQDEEGKRVFINELVGKEIDQQERQKYKLFSDIDEFQSAVYVWLPDNNLILKITYMDEETGAIQNKTVRQPADAVKEIAAYIENFEKRENSKIDSVNVNWKPGTAFYIELGGKAFYSLNTDYRWNKTDAVSLGIQQIGDGFIPSFMYYRFRGEKYRTEIGGGLSGIFDDGFAAVMVHGVYGYRYEKKNGLLFRISFTPFIGIPLKSSGRFVIMPWAGISLGYSL